MNARPRILAIDDTPANLFVVASSLSREFEFQLADSGAAGLEFAAKDRPDLILLDIMMPEMDGFETCRRIREDSRLKDLPIIFMTALHDVSTEVSGLSLQADDYLHKPINIDIARQRISNVLERYALRRKLEQQRDELDRQVELRTAELRRTNAELLVARDQAIAANRAKSTFLGNMSHELRTPLNIILGNGALLRKSITDEKSAGKLAAIQQAGENLLDIISDLLAIAHLDSTTPGEGEESFDPMRLALGAMAPFREVAQRKGLNLRHEVTPDTPRRLRGMATPLTHILKNLIANAVKFSLHGTIAVRICAGERQGDRISMRFEVADQGIGIDEQFQGRLFTEFAQADDTTTRAHGGLGIGLAVCRQIIEVLGGSIGVSSRLGEGSTFHFELPLTIDCAAPEDAHASDDRATPPPDLPAEAVRESATALLDLLDADDFRARSAWDAGRQSIAPLLGSRLDEFESAIESIHFEAASHILKETLHTNTELTGRPS